MSDVQRVIAARVAPHLRPGEIVNLGIGIPTLVADLLAPADEVHLETENGLLGVGPAPEPELVDPALVNAGKLPVTALPGSSYFSSSASFGLIRGGHVTTAVLGALQIDARGRIANWAVPGRPILGVGGAMDLLVGARRVIVATTHTTKTGEAKLVRECTYPLSADRAVDLVVTEAATFAVDSGGLVLVEVADGVAPGWVAGHTEAPFRVAGGVAA
ncbi:MAG TPA: 3-oxoacid CoA-transferase subunit B [Solirubrobacteraceae bacterium]|nr:3-oxoacid CoA-transferase subunit B [Solirubrobacteraceae bacterium]